MISISRRSAPKSERWITCVARMATLPGGGWRLAYEDSRHNYVIENMIPTPNEDALWEMMLDEAVSPPLVSQILLRLLDHPDADPALPITPLSTLAIAGTSTGAD